MEVWRRKRGKALNSINKGLCNINRFFLGFIVIFLGFISINLKNASKLSINASKSNENVNIYSTNEVTSQSTSRYTLFTVVNYDLYQDKRQTNQQTNDIQVTNDRQTADK